MKHALSVLTRFLIAAIVGWASNAIAAQPITNLKFSNEELSLLKRLDQIQTGAGVDSSMLKGHFSCSSSDRQLPSMLR